MHHNLEGLCSFALLFSLYPHKGNRIMSETEAKHEAESWEQKALNEKLQRGRELRTSADLIYRRAVVHFRDGSNWQPLDVYIHPKNINEEGYIEEIWIVVEPEEVELNQKTYTVYSHYYAGVIHSGEAWIHHLDFFKSHPPLQLSEELRVKYIVNPDL